MNKIQAEKAAANQAAELSRIAMRLGRAPAEQVDKLLIAADVCMQRYKAAKRSMRASPVAEINGGVIEDLEIVMQSLTDVIKDSVAPRAYALFVFTNEPGGSNISFTTNAKYVDLAQVLREFIDAAEEGGT